MINTLALVGMIAGYALIGITAFRIWTGLRRVFPFACESSLWWTKHTPLIGMAILLIAAGESILFSILGLIIISGSSVWLGYCRQHRIG